MLLDSLNVLPSQDAEHGTEPLLYTATSPAAVACGYYGPGGRFGLVGPTAARPPRRARDAAAAARLWAEAERLTAPRCRPAPFPVRRREAPPRRTPAGPRAGTRRPGG
jgi:hypothetical protein